MLGNMPIIFKMRETTAYSELYIYIYISSKPGEYFFFYEFLALGLIFCTRIAERLNAEWGHSVCTSLCLLVHV